MPDGVGMPTPDLIGATEAARLIGCDKTTLTRAVADGRIAKAHKLPGKNGAFLFATDEVDRFAAVYKAENDLVPAASSPPDEGGAA